MTMLAKGTKWINCGERNPEKYGKYRVLCTKRGQKTEDEYLWNGSYWVTPGGNPSKGVEAWAEVYAAPAAENHTLTLADYEARIHLYKEQIGTGYIGIGRTLNEAKAAGAVPHGEWESWVTRVTGLTPRQAQRCMQAATEIRDGSALARLEMSKALMLLSSGLDEETREEVAEKAAEDGATVRQLKDEIARIRQERAAADEENRETVKALKLKLVQETGTAAEIREALRRAKSERESLEQQLKATISAYQKQMDEAEGDAYRRGLQDKAAGMEQDIRKEFQGKIDFINGERQRAEETIGELRKRLEKMEKDGRQAWDYGFEAGKKEAAEIRREVNEQRTREIDSLQEALDASEKELAGAQNEANKQRQYAEELRAELEAAEAREAKRAAELAALRKEKVQAGMDAARGIGAQAMGTVDLAAAVRDFIGRAGVLPQMGAMISGMGKKDRDAILAQVETVGKWVSDSLAALGVVKADARIQ